MGSSGASMIQEEGIASVNTPRWAKKKKIANLGNSNELKVRRARNRVIQE